MSETDLYRGYLLEVARLRLPVVPIRLNPGKFCGIGAFVKFQRGVRLERKDFTLIEGAPPGSADYLVLLAGGASLFLEFKTERGTQREAQHRFEQLCVRLGHDYRIVRSVAEAVAVTVEALRARARGPIIPSATVTPVPAPAAVGT